MLTLSKNTIIVKESYLKDKSDSHVLINRYPMIKNVVVEKLDISRSFLWGVVYINESPYTGELGSIGKVARDPFWSLFLWMERKHGYTHDRRIQ